MHLEGRRDGGCGWIVRGQHGPSVGRVREETGGRLGSRRAPVSPYHWQLEMVEVASGKRSGEGWRSGEEAQIDGFLGGGSGRRIQPCW